MKDFLLDRVYKDELSLDDRRKLTLFNNENFFMAYDQVDVDGCVKYRIPRYFYENPSYEADGRTVGDPINLHMKSEFKPLDEYQQNAINAIVNNDHGLVCARVGFGKTYVAIDAIVKMGLKTLIVVHNASTGGLMDQWISCIEKYTGCTEVGIIRANKCDTDKPICITTVQTLCSKVRRGDTAFLKKMYEANFGVTIYDECHVTVGAPEFSESTKAIFSKRLYGLSATPLRSDGLSALLHWFIGPEIYNDGIMFVLPMYISMLDIPIPLGKSIKYIEYGSKQGLNARYSKILAKNDAYMRQIVNMADQCIEAGRNPLVLSARIDTLYTMQEMSKYKDMISVIHAEAEDKNYTNRAIFATYGMFKMAIDVPHLDTLIFATPLTTRSGLIQAIGRVSRKVASNPNKAVMVIDINNSAYNVTNQMRQYRLRYYDEIKQQCLKPVTFVELNSYEDVSKLCTVIKQRSVSDNA